MDGIVLKDGIEEMDFEKVADMLSEADWSTGIKIDEVKKGAYNSSLVVGAFWDGTQIGYARVVSDKTRFAYILDVYIQQDYRRKGVGQQIMEYILSHDELKDVYQWMLITDEAHGLYEKFGFRPVSRPLDLMEIRKDRPKRK
ncbi:MAG: GNAT family N-acetyltransferase [Methanobacterium sp.]|jgi:GNAT superfamily N-acetyltransferase|nr:GNAT family N-acetyltransferase [Methanobacterium subterraneum]MDO5835343.1 GNAT family N-acetyltransferase [Methanobacterium sp.]